MSTLRVLFVEDSELDVELERRALEQAGHRVESRCVENAAAMREALAGGRWDVVLADCRLPRFNANSALAVLHESGWEIPFIVVTGTVSDREAVALMRAGATDYVLKDNLVRLAPVVERTVAEVQDRRQARAKLLDSMERLNLALDAARLGIWEWDLAANSLYFSPECRRMVGVETFACTWEALAALVHPDDLPRAVEEAKSAIAARESYSTELRIRRGDGELRWILNFAQARYSADGAPERLIGIVQDITERKRAEEQLSRSQTLLNSMISSALDGFIVMDSKGSVVLWNRAAETMFGYTAAEAEGRQLHELVAPESTHAAYMAGLRTFFATGEGRILRRIIELTAQRRDGVEFPVELGVAPLYLSGQLHAVGVVRDITERKRAEVALRESEQRWQFALESAGDGVWDWNAQTGTTFFSRQWKALLGYEDHEIGSNPSEFSDRIHPDDVQTFQEALDRHHAGETLAYSVEYRLRCKDGSYKPILGRGRVIERAPDGTPLRMIGIHTDLTPLKAAEAERERLQTQFFQAQKMESLGRLAGGIAHDFNNLLTVINGYAGLSLTNLPADASLREPLEQIHGAGERATALVRQLLAFSRKSPPAPDSVNLNDVVEDLRKTVLRLVGEDIRIVCSLAPDLPLTVADRNQVEQLLLNLVVNSRDAMPNGGVLTIETAIATPQGVCALCNREIPRLAYVALRVRDTGTGVNEQTLRHMFEPFFTTKPVGQGTGLGLSVVHGIVRQSNGHLQVTSELGVGVEMSAYFPLGAERKAAPAPRLRAAVGHGETVVLVEDAPEVRLFLVRVLDSFGYRVLDAPSGPAALELLAAEPADLLITDVVMPTMDGRELASRARALQPDLPILFVSGYSADVIDSSKGLLAGEEFIVKPVSPDALASAVRRILAGRRHSTRILVVDDEPGIRGYVRSVLERSGYIVDEADDGAVAISKIRQAPPDLVITDLVMPEKEGLELISVLRRSYPSVRILAMSGAAGGRFLPIAEHLGADGSLPKPVGPAELLAKVRELLSPQPAR
ncbi:MAG: response regulator [Acidobacteria bacterium]|nr:response regulator [Acidobacteriota bacterium]